MRIGCNLSIAKGLDKAIHMAEEVNANTFQFFTRNPRGGSARVISSSEIKNWKVQRSSANLFPIIGHLPYTVNPASSTPKSYEFAKMCLREDLQRMDAIGAEFLVFHPGSYVKGGVLKGIERIVLALTEVFSEYNGDAMLLLETMTGKGTEIGSNPEELGIIIKALNNPAHLGVCLDSCHLFAAGYDLRKEEEIDRMVGEFDRHVGLDNIKAAHLNDSKMDLGSNKDRHALIGQGLIGTTGIANFINHPHLRHLPFVLETPVNDYLGYGDEILAVKHLRCKSHSCI